MDTWEEQLFLTSFAPVLLRSVNGIHRMFHWFLCYARPQVTLNNVYCSTPTPVE